MRRILLFGFVVLSLIGCAVPQGNNATPTIAPSTDTPVVGDVSTTTIAELTPTLTTTITETPAATLQPMPSGGEILFLQQTNLVAYSVVNATIRPILAGVIDFAVSPDGKNIVAIKHNDFDSLWLIDRATTTSTQLTDDQRTFATIAWLPDSSGFLYASSPTKAARATTWLTWATFCRDASVAMRTLANPQEQKIGDGCDPAVSPDGKRIAYVTRPSRADASSTDSGFTAGNKLHLVNLQGANGWDPVTADGKDTGDPKAGLVLYRPVWSTDSRSILYHVFIGMRVEVDINLFMQVDARDGTQTLLNSFAGWARYTSISPTGDTYALSTQDVGDARGLSGWDVWDAALFDFAGKRDIYLPEGTFSATGTAIGETQLRAQAHAWQPDGKALALVLPPLWSPGIPPSEEYGYADEAGELWLWPRAGTPSKKLTDQVDSQSPLAWVP
jgi:hypothetical protein